MVSKRDFAAGVRSLGLNVSAEECDRLFEQLLKQATPPALQGRLDMFEATRLLKSLHDAAAHADADALAQAKTVALLRKASKMQAVALRKALAEDDAEARDERLVTTGRPEYALFLPDDRPPQQCDENSAPPPPLAPVVVPPRAGSRKATTRRVATEYMAC